MTKDQVDTAKALERLIADAKAEHEVVGYKTGIMERGDIPDAYKAYLYRVADDRIDDFKPKP